MRVGVPKETAQGERRVALVPEAVRRLTGFEVVVEAGAGESAGFADPDYVEAGATVGDPWSAAIAHTRSSTERASDLAASGSTPASAKSTSGR